MTRLEQDEAAREAELVELLADGWTLRGECFGDEVPVKYAPRWVGDPHAFVCASESHAGTSDYRFAPWEIRTHVRASSSV